MLVGAAGLLAAALAAFVVEASEDSSPPALVVADVEGVWTVQGGSRLTVRADGSAELERVEEPDVNCGQSTGPAPLTYTGPATWVFDSYPDEAPGIRFDYRSRETEKLCEIYLVVGADEHASYGFLPHVADVQYVRPGSAELTARRPPRSSVQR
ncbi:hypothetical protein ACFYV5_07930 [Streptomyces sp. NPDC003035]|uniref:hypothetical protein n=1 Tax=Streptomyces sp. NPDC003035 TaxID=3364676 RepID=UPI00369DB30D